MRHICDVAIIGGGILGLATAMKMAKAFPHKQITVLEKEREPAAHQTGHNSGVIHSGIYYRPGSLKARFCRNGAEQLRRFCLEQSIPVEFCGKVVVATSSEEIPRLQELHRRGTANGVTGLRLLTPEGVKEIEPHVKALQGLHVPATGIVDFKEVAKGYARVFTRRGGSILLGTKVTKIRTADGSVRIETSTGELVCRTLINCGGLYSDRISRMGGVEPPCSIVPFRGEYYKIAPSRAHLVNALIYPVPDPRFPFLGVHFTRMINGSVEAGPNAVLAWAREGYTKTSVNVRDLAEIVADRGMWRLALRYLGPGMEEMKRSFSKRLFTQALQALIPEIQSEDLEPGGAGVRAQALDRNGNLLDDFVIQADKRMIHVLNAPSPAATSSLAIADHLVECYVDHAGEKPHL